MSRTSSDRAAESGWRRISACRLSAASRSISPSARAATRERRFSSASPIRRQRAPSCPRPSGLPPNCRLPVTTGPPPFRSPSSGEHAFNRTFVNIPFTKHTLDNGLDVLLHEEHACPIVAVNIWYHVGSKNERPGHTGFAHLFEHLMFEGSQHHNAGYFQPLQQAGAQLNGSTNTDRTNYWEVVPTSALDRALWMESDRMGYLLPALTPERFETQRNVVLNERRQSYENRPYGLALMALMSGLFPHEHPYRWPTIGDVADLEAMQFEQVREFFRTYYGPSNASLVLAGDIEPDRGFDLAERYFGDLSPGTRARPVQATASLTGERRFVLEDRVELPRLYMAWHTPAMFEPDDAELDLVGDLVANGKTARLYKSLVFEDRIALDVSAAQQSRELGS